MYDPQGSVQQRHTDGSCTGGYAAYDRSTFEGYGALRAAYKGSTGAGVGQHDPSGFGGQYGYYTDTETGLLCLTHRYYDPGTGKFINRDPIGYKGGINLYGFVGNNPVNESDPSGFDKDWLDYASEFSAGAGDIISGGYTQKFRAHIGYDDMVDKESGVYRGGQIAGVGYLAVDSVVGGVGLVNGVRAIRAAGGVRGIVAAATITRAKNLGLNYQIRSGGAVHVLKDVKTLAVTETHSGIGNAFKRYNGGRVNLVRRSFWKHVLPHEHTYSLGSPPSGLNANWRNTFQRAGAAKTTELFKP